jgi:hypothetical protein
MLKFALYETREIQEYGILVSTSEIELHEFRRKTKAIAFDEFILSENIHREDSD